jgi:hypothetical protein
MPKLDLRIYPRYSVYDSSSMTASFIVDNLVQYQSGSPYTNKTYEDNSSTPVPFTQLELHITNRKTKDILVEWSTRIPVNTTGNEITFSLKSMKPNRRNPWPVDIIANSPDGTQSFHASTEVTVLPCRNDTGSISRIDHATGALEVKSALTNQTWKPIFPYSFYTSWDWIASTINNSSATKNLTTFRDLGYNIIHPVPPGGSDPFNHTLLEAFLTICDSLELYVMYDMRHTYQNHTSISAQLAPLQSHPSLLLYYTADEPDGAGDPLNATRLSYNYIKSVDPYHPVSLVLNCANFYFEQYTAGADIILEDAYPIAANTSFSPVYHTPCNATYGDCGCDNCHANDPAYPAYVKNTFLDISERTDTFYQFQTWLQTSSSRTPGYTKPIWGVPQAFWDPGSFWSRWPSGDEEVVMAMLRVNHGAKGIVAWIYPTSEELEGATSRLAGVLTGERVMRYTIGSAGRVGGVRVGGVDEELVDVSVWVGKESVLVSVVYVGYGSYEGEVRVEMPEGVAVEDMATMLLGPEGWKSDGSGMVVTKAGLGPLEVGILEFARVAA